MDDGPNARKGKDTSNRAQVALQWSLWQLIDSCLPTGGFAHSMGMEAGIQAHMIKGADDLETITIQILENTGSLLLPFVRSAASCPSADNWLRLDALLDATLTNEFSRKASIAQGSALTRVAAAMFVQLASLRATRDRGTLAAAAPSFHHAPAFGLVCGLLGIDSEVSQRAYMHVTLRDAISSATRLNLLGPLAAAVLQHKVSAIAETILQRWMDRPVEDACQTAPLLDTLHGCHAYLFSRIFCS